MWFRAAPGVLSSLATLLLDLSVRERWHRVASEARWLSVGPGTTPAVKGRVIVKSGRHGFFIFIFFISVFYKNIFSSWKFTEIYPGRPAAGRPGPSRPAAGRHGLICKKKRENKIAARSLGTGRPAAGRPASQAARLGAA